MPEYYGIVQRRHRVHLDPGLGQELQLRQQVLKTSLISSVLHTDPDLLGQVVYTEQDSTLTK
jgi:hypothetical protein